MLQHVAAQRGFAGADFARQDEEAFAPPNAGEEPLAGGEKRWAVVDKSLIDRVTTLVKVEGLLQELLPVVTDVARQYLDGSLTQERAVERLTHDALVANPQGTLAFIERRRARALVYGEGRRVIYELMTTRDLAGLDAAFRRAAAVQ